MAFLRATVTAFALLAVSACGSSGAPHGASSGTGGKTATGGGLTCAAESQHQGEATYYTTADGTGNCGFDATPDDLDIGAMNAADYEGSAACGACAKIQGPKGTLTVRVVDQCPDCAKGNIDLSPSAFDEIAEHSAGRVPITWEYVSCATPEHITYRFKDGSNPWWTAVQIRNHRYGIAKFEYENGGTFVEVPRESYNYFVAGGGMGPGPYTFRVTDVYGDTLTDTGIPLKDAAEVDGAAQFPVCAP